MNRIKHKITVVLALFGVVFIAPVALAQTTVGAAGEAANIEIIARPPTIAAPLTLEFGQIFRPASGNPEFGLVCGVTGDETVEDVVPPLAAPSSTERRCGEVTLTAGEVTLSGYNLSFGAGTTDLVGVSTSLNLQTTYVLYGGTDNIEIDADDGTAGTETTEGADVAAGVTASFYVGGRVEVPSATSTAQVYSGAYEIVLTLP